MDSLRRPGGRLLLAPTVVANTAPNAMKAPASTLSTSRVMGRAVQVAVEVTFAIMTEKEPARNQISPPGLVVSHTTELAGFMKVNDTPAEAAE